MRSQNPNRNNRIERIQTSNTNVKKHKVSKKAKIQMNTDGEFSFTLCNGNEPFSVKAQSASQAAKKTYRKFKLLNELHIRDDETDEVIVFQTSDFSLDKEKKPFKKKRQPRDRTGANQIGENDFD